MADTSKETETFANQDRDTILHDYKIAVTSREASYLGRKEVLTGKAKFGIFGDGKELPQIAMAKYFQKGDFRSGYYRDQTFMMAIGELTVQQFFAQLYAHPSVEADPHSGGRQMNAHFSTRSLNEDGTWKDLTEMKNTSPDMSPTAGQMSRLLGLAQASKFYRQSNELGDESKFSKNGQEVAFGTIGDASTSEGIFWEAMNAAGVLQIPMVMSVWDDGYGISVSKKYQTTKESISKIMRGFQRGKTVEGIEVVRVKAWDYEALLETYKKVVDIAREEHAPALVHVEEVTQPQGHSTSGSHERYKSDERLQWEKEYDCIHQFRKWIEEHDIATADELDALEEEAKQEVRDGQKAAWKAFRDSIEKDLDEILELIGAIEAESGKADQIASVKKRLKQAMNPIRKDILSAAKKTLRLVRGESLSSKQALIDWLEEQDKINTERYDSNLLSETEQSPMKIEAVPPTYDEDPQKVDGRVVLRDNFDKLFEKYPNTLVFGEDTGQLGDVNLGLENMQEKFGELRVFDTGIRENTIVGQGIGMALRGLRPIAEIQYLDYLLYAFQVMSDDLATVRYRSAGGQKAPLIVRTRGHRLEGIWHSGSPMGMVIHGLRGIHVCVPRNLTDAAGMYNTLLEGDDPALIIEPLNAYRLKEDLPSNLGEFKTPLGVPEVVKEGTDITLVSYGSTCNLVEQTLPEFEEVGISAELIDIKTLLPFDKNHSIVESLKKTNRIVFIDEDMPGGATSFMMQQVLEVQKGYFYLDSEPLCITAKNHRPAYGSDGDYFSKPNAEDIFDGVYNIMREAYPEKYPAIYE
ncbi:MAG: alpha-ketoacid dehydrogenase subunit alpha/beta [Bacteroidota bacterium]